MVTVHGAGRRRVAAFHAVAGAEVDCLTAVVGGRLIG
jgi:hypothetical protein